MAGEEHRSPDLGVPEMGKPLAPQNLPIKHAPGVQREWAAGASGYESKAKQAQKKYINEVKSQGIDEERSRLRASLEDIEVTGYPSDARIHQDTIKELTQVETVMSPEVSREFQARKAFHDFYLVFAMSQSAEKCVEAARGVTNETIDTLFKLRGEGDQPVFANAFRSLEELGNEFVLAKDTGAQKDKTKLKMIVSWMATGMDHATAEQKVASEGKGSEEMWASAIAEKFWYASGRAAYYDAYNSDVAQRLKGDSKDFQKNIFNFRQYLENKKLGAYFLRNRDKADNPITYGGSHILQVRSVDFFSRLGIDFDGIAATSHDPDTNFIPTLGTVRLEDIDFLSTTTATSFADNMDACDKAGLLLADSKDTTGFLYTLDQNTLSKLLASKLYSHLKGDERDLAILSAVELIIEYQRIRPEFKKKSAAQLEAYSDEAAKKITPWSNETINEQILFFSQFIKNPSLIASFKTGLVDQEALARKKALDKAGKVGAGISSIALTLLKYTLGAKK